MIQLPRRSVTRFFIPLIDVLTLLFCIFLLMPLLKHPSEGESPSPTTDQDLLPQSGPPAGKNALADKTALDRALQERLRAERQELERLRKDKAEVLQQRLFIRVLEIDADTGKLFYQEGDQRVEVDSQDEALKLIARNREEAGNRELYYLFLYPRRLTGYPEEGQIKRYDNWFKGVAHGIDNPRATR
jgi:hypothetical protein